MLHRYGTQQEKKRNSGAEHGIGQSHTRIQAVDHTMDNSDWPCC
jgi:hypothetical protein